MRFEGRRQYWRHPRHALPGTQLVICRSRPAPHAFIAAAHTDGDSRRPGPKPGHRTATQTTSRTERPSGYGKAVRYASTSAQPRAARRSLRSLESSSSPGRAIVGALISPCGLAAPWAISADPTGSSGSPRQAPPQPRRPPAPPRYGSPAPPAGQSEPPVTAALLMPRSRPHGLDPGSHRE